MTRPEISAQDVAAKTLAGRLSAAVPVVSRETALVWSRSLLQACPDLQTCSQAVMTTAEACDRVTLAALHRGLSHVRKPKPQEVPALPARAMPTADEARENARRARAIIEGLVRKL